LTSDVLPAIKVLAFGERGFSRLLSMMDFLIGTGRFKKKGQNLLLEQWGKLRKLKKKE